MFDTIIIGGGPAGFTAAIYASRREMKTLLVTKDFGGQVLWASEIENYPGFTKIENYDLINKMHEQVKAQPNVEIRNEEVKLVEEKNGVFIITTEKEKFDGN